LGDAPPVAFYLQHLEHPGNVGRHWVTQTVAHLQSAGFPVELTKVFPKSGIVCALHDDLRAPLARFRSNAFVICLDVDRAGLYGPNRWAPFHVVHNPVDPQLKKGNAHYIPPWTHEGMIPRDPGRGDRFKTIAFVGTQGGNLVGDLRRPEWDSWCRGNGVEWHMGSSLCWEDYSWIDCIVAVRHWGVRPYYHKPVLKLINAWTAGIPAILGAETAYQFYRRGPLDYIEAKSLEEVKCALLRLQRCPSLRAEMIANGRERAKDFTPEVNVQRWISFFEQVAYHRFAEYKPRRLLVRRASRQPSRQLLRARPAPRNGGVAKQAVPIDGLAKENPS